MKKHHVCEAECTPCPADPLPKGLQRLATARDAGLPLGARDPPTRLLPAGVRAKAGCVHPTPPPLWDMSVSSSLVLISRPNVHP